MSLSSPSPPLSFSPLFHNTHLSFLLPILYFFPFLSSHKDKIIPTNNIDKIIPTNNNLITKQFTSTPIMPNSLSPAHL